MTDADRTELLAMLKRCHETMTDGEWWAGVDEDGHIVYSCETINGEPSAIAVADTMKESGDAIAETADAKGIAALRNALPAIIAALAPQPRPDVREKVEQLLSQFLATARRYEAMSDSEFDDYTDELTRLLEGQ